MIEGIQTYESVPIRWKARLRVRQDSVSGRQFVDMRSLLAVRLLALNSSPVVQTWIKERKDELLKESISDYDKALLNQLL